MFVRQCAFMWCILKPVLLFVLILKEKECRDLISLLVLKRVTRVEIGSFDLFMLFYSFVHVCSAHATELNSEMRESECQFQHKERQECEFLKHNKIYVHYEMCGDLYMCVTRNPILCG